MNIPAATRKLKPMTITCTKDGQSRSFIVQSEKIFLPRPDHRMMIMRLGGIKDEAVRKAKIAEAHADLQYRGYGNSIVVNF
ncbi:MAG: hypothetical protein WBC85_14815 [Planktotalea sp.]|uniref:hypothetical protein n=1 Tax=Planktotalea sp. TaxID=2029877 RepID=UPI003C72E5EB